MSARAFSTHPTVGTLHKEFKQTKEELNSRLDTLESAVAKLSKHVEDILIILKGGVKVYPSEEQFVVTTLEEASGDLSVSEDPRYNFSK